ncbi:hypothetical protein D2T33_12310 [Sinirhodobacter populi]|uniref:Large polyvalent protein-associated domain-containing protein n=1 Tax=Paenirhodobacter populi TaxID=2306993 RepID=A0A443IT81_9RHOB|nr:hypothetical protein [Sinirhodobacter populi]RWR10440.1 hypothetical protein D2T33_12310 [Sinirhodobacter populi]
MPRAFEIMGEVERHRRAYSALRTEYDQLPPEFRDVYREVRRSYDRLGDEFEAAVLENMKLATQVAIRRAERKHTKEMDRIRDEGLEGDAKREAVDAADAALAAVKKRGGWARNARMSALRSEFESNRLNAQCGAVRPFWTERNGRAQHALFPVILWERCEMNGMAAWLLGVPALAVDLLHVGAASVQLPRSALGACCS